MDGEGEPVQLYVYDLSRGLARQLSPMLLGKQIDGIWHSAIVVGGVEYYFGFGINESVPGHTPFGQPTHIYDLGTTFIPEEVRDEFLTDLSERYTPATYSLLHNNCNSFADELAHLLVGTGIPSHITGLPAEVMSTPFGQMILPMLQGLEQQLGSVRQQAFHPHYPHPGHTAQQGQQGQQQLGTATEGPSALAGMAAAAPAPAPSAAQQGQQGTAASGRSALAGEMAVAPASSAVQPLQEEQQQKQEQQREEGKAEGATAALAATLAPAPAATAAPTPAAAPAVETAAQEIAAAIGLGMVAEAEQKVNGGSAKGPMEVQGSAAQHAWTAGDIREVGQQAGRASNYSAPSHAPSGEASYEEPAGAAPAAPAAPVAPRPPRSAAAAASAAAAERRAQSALSEEAVRGEFVRLLAAGMAEEEAAATAARAVAEQMKEAAEGIRVQA